MDQSHRLLSRFRNARLGVGIWIIGTLLVMGTTTGVVIASSKPIPLTTNPAYAAHPIPEGSTPHPGTSDSICGLVGIEHTNTLTTPPQTLWEGVGIVTYPYSSTYGPGAISGSGFPYCFHHSPQGAVFAAAAHLAQSTKEDPTDAWLDYFIASGLHREATLVNGAIMNLTNAYSNMKVAGFTIESYDAERAEIDLAIQAITDTDSHTTKLVMSFDLVWQSGDWKLRVSSPSHPVEVVRTTHFNDYILWEN
ncbi:MAG TPA: hypothetical protein VK054_06810 [Beutenbergiaceae bacterium]|nr:hypothetical protein [Beutenbergiaceae bacterium]